MLEGIPKELQEKLKGKTPEEIKEWKKKREGALRKHKAEVKMVEFAGERFTEEEFKKLSDEEKERLRKDYEEKTKQ